MNLKKSDKDIERQLRGEDERTPNLELFQKVREFIRAHPGSTAEDIAVALGVEERVILKFLKEGRLVKR